MIRVREIFFQGLVGGINEGKVNESETEFPLTSQAVSVTRNNLTPFYLSLSLGSSLVSPRFAREQLAPGPAYSLS